MPKVPTHPSIIREIRSVLGWDQKKLGKRIGISFETIRRVENGSLPPSRKLAIRLFWATGVSFEDILSNRPGRPRSWPLGEPLERDAPKRLEDRARALSETEVETMIDNVRYYGELTLLACKEIAPEKIWALDAAILLKFEELQAEFNLGSAIKRQKEKLSDPSLLERVKQRSERAKQRSERAKKLPVGTQLFRIREVRSTGISLSDDPFAAGDSTRRRKKKQDQPKSCPD
jgi:DNA-binding XRE family transcriptional regulator